MVKTIYILNEIKHFDYIKSLYENKVLLGKIERSKTRFINSHPGIENKTPINFILFVNNQHCFHTYPKRNNIQKHIQSIKKFHIQEDEYRIIHVKDLILREKIKNIRKSIK